MATILEFRRGAGRAERPSLPDDGEAGAGEIVLFPGVRYGRDYEAVMDAAGDAEPADEEAERTGQ
jgi:hypothetical protein